jgi:predicted nucleic acid-binding protein
VIVVSDTSVISGLLQSERLYILQKLYKKVVIPAEVFIELTKLDQQLLSALQSEWIEVKNVKKTVLLTELSVLLDPGEAEAISLAK